MKSNEYYMQLAYELALKSYQEGGCPIGSLLVDNKTGEVLGKGHNSLVQESNPILHGEMAALRDAGRMKNRHKTTLYTTLSPCLMCSGMIIQFGIPRVVIADTVNSLAKNSLALLESHHVVVCIMDDKTNEVAASCISLVDKFKNESPDQWLEDWGGGENLRLK